MSSFGSIAWSSVGKKVITGLTGLALFGFVVVHLIGNLTLFLGPDAFNGYAHFLETALHGWLTPTFEIFLIIIFLFHMISAINVAWADKRAARKTGYKTMKNAGGKSRKTFSSVSMIYTGILILIYVVGHIYLFKFGNHEISSDGVKNLYKTVVTEFKDPVFTVFTVVVMVMLGLHLRHGFWSAFQSLGLANDKYLPVLEKLALFFAIVLAIGFILIPILLFLNGDPNAPVGMGGH